MTEHVQVGGLQVAKVLFDFVNNEAIPGTGITADQFWAGADKVIHDLAPKNKALLAKRDDFQARIDTWHQTHAGQAHDPVAYKAFLQDIGYLLPEAADFQASTQNVDDEIARMAGPQLVVPVMNARFALNASNARWGSLYDALYGTDAISEADGAEKGQGYNKVRGDKVIAFARAFLDEAAPLSAGSHVDSTGYKIVDGKLVVSLKGGSNSGLRDDAQLIGFQGDSAQPIAILLKHNGLHFEIQIDASTPVGQTDAAGVKDVLMEAALTTIMDCEDSVAAVDADDKVVIYRNWLGLMKGDLAEEVAKGGKTFTRTMNADRVYTGVNGQARDAARSLAAVRAQRWPLDDHRRDPRQKRQRSTGRHSRRPAHQPGGDPQPQRQQQPQEQPHRFRVHRETEDARPGRSGVHQRAVRPHRRRAEPAAQHPQGRDHGRGAPYHGQPQGLHQGRQRARGVYQHRLPRPHRR
jgi:malate synthase